MVRVEDFLAIYPLPEDPNFSAQIFKRKEFYELRLEPIEQVPEKRGQYLRHQKLLQRFVSPHTQIDGLLLFHGLGSGKCVAPDTKILTSEGYLSAEDIHCKFVTQESRDSEGGLWSRSKNIIKVISYDEKRGRMVTGLVANLYRQKVDEKLVVVGLQNGTEIKITQKHKLLTSNGWSTNFKEGHCILTFPISSDNKYTKIKYLRVEQYSGWVYDFEVDRYHNYVANGILCHNTCSAISIEEQRKAYLRETGNKPNRALVLVKGDTIADNWRREISTKCTGGQYLPDSYKTKADKDTRSRALVRKAYDIQPYLAFLNTLGDPDSVGYKTNIAQYNNTLIIIDEIQNIRIQSDKPGSRATYNKLHKFLHAIKRTKVLLLSATPMWDQSNEIASVLNLILPLDRQLPTGKDFDQKYLNNVQDQLEDLKKYFSGRVSYVRAPRTTAKVIYEGIKGPWLKHLIVYPTSMSEFQAQALRKASTEITIQRVKKRKKLVERRVRGGPFQELPRQASSFVWPDGTYSSKSFQKYINEKNLLIRREYREDIKNNLRKYSAKFYKAIQFILNNPKELIFVYTDFVRGAGSILFGALLNLFGLTRVSGSTETSASSTTRSYVIVSDETARGKTAERIRDAFNSPQNAEGDLIQVFIGSRKVGQGITLKRVKQVHILSPHWNLPAIEQAIGRALRLDSHMDVINPEVRIYRHVAVLANPPESTNFLPTMTSDLDLYYRAEQKDFQDKVIERVIKESAIDCALAYRRNVLPNDVNESRDCDYRECNYMCDGLWPTRTVNGIYRYEIQRGDIDDKTYNIFYSRVEMLQVVDEIQNLFQHTFYVKIQDLFSLFRKHKPFIILKAVDNIISSRRLIYNAYGFPSYLKEKGDLVFLDTSVGAKRQFSDSYYVERPFAIREKDLSSVVNSLEFTHDTDIIDEACPLTPAKISNLMKNLHYASVVTFIERAYRFLQLPLNQTSVNARAVAQTVLDEAPRSIIEIDGGQEVFHRMYVTEYKGRGYILDKTTSKITGKLRCWNENAMAWYWCSEDDEERHNLQLKEIVGQEEERMFDEGNTWGFYGRIISGKFLIVKRVKKGEGRKKSGISCVTSIKKPDLIDMIIKAGIKPLINDDIEEMDRATLLRVRVEDKEKLSDDELKILVTLNKASKSDLCSLIRSFLERKGYVVTV